MCAIRDWLRSSFVLLTCAALLGLAGCKGSQSRVVLYCSQDRDFAVGLLKQFDQQSGLQVEPKFDTEANKSVSLYREIVEDGDKPRCDVFWNNEPLNTLRLQKAGLLEPYDSPSAKPYPAWAKAKDHTWHAFASRARVLLVRKSVPEKDRPRSLFDLVDPRFKGKVVMGKAHHSTAATQAACLFAVLGPDLAKQYYRALKANGLQQAPGNKQVAQWLGRGLAPNGREVLVGVTDTDDALDEVKEGRDVVIIFPDRDARDTDRGVKQFEKVLGEPVVFPGEAKKQMGTLFIPNTVAILKGAPNPEGARKLVDFLLSADTEKQLAEGESGQIPLNPEVKAALPKQIETPRTAKAMEVDWGKAAELWEETQKFLTKEFAAP
jgi:iron(III) transport system substrate-binding protein